MRWKSLLGCLLSLTITFGMFPSYALAGEGVNLHGVQSALLSEAHLTKGLTSDNAEGKKSTPAGGQDASGSAGEDSSDPTGSGSVSGQDDGADADGTGGGSGSDDTGSGQDDDANNDGTGGGSGSDDTGSGQDDDANADGTGEDSDSGDTAAGDSDDTGKAETGSESDDAASGDKNGEDGDGEDSELPGDSSAGTGDSSGDAADHENADSDEAGSDEAGSDENGSDEAGSDEPASDETDSDENGSDGAGSGETASGAAEVTEETADTAANDAASGDAKDPNAIAGFEEQEIVVTEIETDNDTEEAISRFTEAVIDLSKDPETLEGLQAIMERVSGLGSAVSGCVSFLQMIGILEDPTEAGIATIITEVKSVQDELHTMDQKLDNLALQLLDLASSEEEKARDNKARDLVKDWQDFNTFYVNPLKNLVTDYEGYVNRGMKHWWEHSSHDGIRVLYASYNKKTVLTYSRCSYAEGTPDQADNGETVLKNDCIGLPAEYVPNTSAESFSMDHYKERFQELTAEAVIKAADDKKLDASQSFYADWAKLDDAGKKSLAQKLAPDFLNTLIYTVSCDVMSKDENDKWVISAINAYSNYCDMVMKTNSGIDALINTLYLTHGFEGEVASDVRDITNSMIATAGYYGSFVLTVAGQDADQTTKAKEDLQKKWVDTIKALDKKGSSALTGHDNYCYIVGAVVDFTQLSCQSDMTMVYRQIDRSDDSRALISFTSGPWKLYSKHGLQTSLPPIVNSVYAEVLYHQFASQKKEKAKTFNEYLNVNGVSVAHFNGLLLTNYQDAETFSLSDGVSMNAINIFGSYFKDGKNYSIFDGSPSKAKGGNFKLHDKVVYDCINMENGDLKVNQTFAARAAYTESHWFWIIDEGHEFYTDDLDWDVDTSEEWVKNFVWKQVLRITKRTLLSKDIAMLSCMEAGTDSLDASSPLLAFDSVHIMKNEAEETAEQDVPKADWSQMDTENLNLYPADDSRIDDGIALEIEAAVLRAEKEGIKVSLTAEEKAKITSEMRSMTYTLQEELRKNRSLRYLDVFGIDGDDDAERKLAEEVLHGSYLTAGGSSKIPPENINTMACYESCAVLHFVRENGEIKYVINPAFNIDPLLVIWDAHIKEFAAFEIYDDVMTGQGLTMNVRIPAASAGDQSTITIIHYTDDIQEEERTDSRIQGSGSDRYAVMRVNKCSPFELVTKKNERKKKSDNGSGSKTSARTGDDSNLLLSGALFASALIALGIVVRRLRKRAGE